MKMCSMLAILASTFVLAGCGGGESVDYPDTAVVKGKVTLDGQAVEGAQVTLSLADQGSTAYAARGTSGPDGTFELRTYFSASFDEPGAVPGKYNVAVLKTAAPPANANPATHSGQAGPPSQMSRGPGAAEAHGVALKYELPKKYASTATSGLTFEVKAGTENTLTLELKSE